jgi:hypothetical protein
LLAWCSCADGVITGEASGSSRIGEYSNEKHTVRGCLDNNTEKPHLVFKNAIRGKGRGASLPLFFSIFPVCFLETPNLTSPIFPVRQSVSRNHRGQFHRSAPCSPQHLQTPCSFSPIAFLPNGIQTLRRGTPPILSFILKMDVNRRIACCDKARRNSPDRPHRIEFLSGRSISLLLIGSSTIIFIFEIKCDIRVRPP